MNNPANTTTSSYPTAAIVSNYNALAKRVHSALRDKGCDVYVISKDIQQWSTYFRENNLRASCYLPTETVSVNINYVVIVDLQQQLHDVVIDESSITTVSRLLQSGASKLIIIRSYEVERELRVGEKYKVFSDFEIQPKTLLVGPIIDVSEESVLGVVTNRSQPFDSNELLPHIERTLFSFAEEKTTALIGNEVLFDIDTDELLVPQEADELVVLSRSPQSDEILRIHIKESLELKPTPTVSPSTVQVPEVKQPSILSPIHLQDIVSEPVETSQTDTNRSEQPISEAPQASKFVTTVERTKKARRKLVPSLQIKKPVIRMPRLKYRKLAKASAVMASIVFAIFVIIPVLLIGANTLTLTVAKNQAFKYKFNSARRIFSLSSALATHSQEYVSALSEITFLESMYASSSRLSTNLHRLSEIGEDGVNVILLSDSLLENMFTKDELDVYGVSRNTALEIDKMITELSFLESSLANSESIDSRISTSVMSVSELSMLRENLLSLKVFVEQIPLLLGANSPQNYVIALQDYSVARPSGGVITHVVIPTFSGGKLIDIDTYEVSYLDDQFKGELTVPYELEEYFNANSWLLGDVGIETNFSINAQSILRYVDNSINLTANGVVAVEDSLIYELSSSSENRITSESVQAMIQKTIETYVQSSYEDRASIIASVGENLDSNKIQGYLVHETLEQQLQENGFAGNISTVDCSGNCYSDIFGVVEVGDSATPISEEIARDGTLEISFEKGLVKRSLTYSMVNKTANQYNSLLKVLAPEDAGYSVATIETSSGVVTVRPDVIAKKNHKEGALFVTVESGDRTTVTLEWESGASIDLDTRGDYDLFLRSQSGIPPYSLDVIIGTSGDRKLFVQSSDSLTDDGIVRYNTQLDRDTSIKVTW